MAKKSFTLNTSNDFTFDLSTEPGTVYRLPALTGLSFEDAEKMGKINEEKSVIKQGPMIKDFIISHNPALADKNLPDMAFYEIFNAYGLSEGREKQGE